MNFPPSLRTATVCAVMLAGAALAVTPAQAAADLPDSHSPQTPFTPAQASPTPDSPNSTAAPNSSPAPSLPLARVLIAAKRWEEALAILAVLHERTGAEQTEVLFLSALAEIGRKQYSTAVEWLRTILDSQPQLLRVRLELARALFLDGDDDASRHHFEYVLAANPPPTVGANVRAFLNQIRGRRGWRLWTNFGIAPDSNINTAPSGDTICIGSICGFVLSEDARQKSGTGWFASLGGEWRKNFAGGRRQFVLNGAIHERDYPDRFADDRSVRLSPGVRFLRERGAVQWSLIADRRWLNGEPYSRGFGTKLSNEHRPTPRLQLEESVETIRRRHDQNENSDGDTRSAALRTTYALSPVSTIRAHLEASQVRTEMPVNSSSSRALFLQYRRDFPAALTASVGVRWSRTLYDGINRLGGIRRRDSFRSRTLTLLKRNWRLFGFAPELSVTWSENNSNLDFNTYRRTHGGLSFTREF